jgi:hypothetical protein
MFGESELDAFKRLRRQEILEPEVDKVIKIHTKLHIVPGTFAFWAV